MDSRPSNPRDFSELDYEETSFGKESLGGPDTNKAADADLVQQHHHDDIDSEKIILPNIQGVIEVVSIVPTSAPRWVYEQIKIYINGATYRLYVYDYLNHVWHYSTLT